MKKYLTEWNMNYRDHRNIHCTVPCSMYGVLYENKLIPDPYYGTNEAALTGYSDYPCEFESRFSVSEKEYGSERIELTCYGLDTIAAIYINSKEIGNAKNMHMAYCFDVKKYIKPGENVLLICFSSPTEYFRQMNRRHRLWSSAETLHGAAHLRKGLSMSGWDWGPQLPDMGIYRPVELSFGAKEKIDDYLILQEHNEGQVRLDVSVNVSGEYDLLRFTIDGNTYEMPGGKCNVMINKPRLWWPRGYGRQDLYEVVFELIKDGAVVDKTTAKIGLRTLGISQDKDDDGREFCFIVNGHKIFAMGANYIPEDSIL